MLIQFPYGDEIIEMRFPDNTVVLSGKEPRVISDDDIDKKIAKPLKDFTRTLSEEKVTIVINDITRRVPTERVLSILFRYLPVEKAEILVRIS